MVTHAKIKAGVKLKGRVVKVRDHGAIVKIPGGIKAFCPADLMSESEDQLPNAEIQVGAKLNFRVFSCNGNRVVVTNKKKLVSSKLKIISSYADAVEGLVTHGCIVNMSDGGIFIQFYNGVVGLARRCELMLEPGCDISSRYQFGQVVKCRVLRPDPAHGILLSCIPPTKTMTQLMMEFIFSVVRLMMMMMLVKLGSDVVHCPVHNSAFALLLPTVLDLRQHPRLVESAKTRGL